MRGTAEGVANIERRIWRSIDIDWAKILAVGGLAPCNQHRANGQQIFLERRAWDSITKGKNSFILCQKEYKKKQPRIQKRKKRETVGILCQTHLYAVANSKYHCARSQILRITAVIGAHRLSALVRAVLIDL